jgi:RNA polymerase sigma-70 factor (ECF subfamily)
LQKRCEEIERSLEKTKPIEIIHIPVRRAFTTDEFSELFDAYYRRIYRYIAYRINNHAAAEDLCSQVFERAWSKQDTFSREKGATDVWLFAIARNTVIDYYRSLKKESHISLGTILDIVSNNPAPDDLVVTNEENKLLWKALNTLREKERSIIAMKYAAELKNTEIAKLLGISESQVGVILFRSMKKLKKHLPREGADFEK